MDELPIPRKPKVVLPKDPAECWEFQGTVTSYGYGQVKVGGKARSCQRWMFEQLFGPAPEGMKVSTTCGNGVCINPYHLVLRTPADTIRASSVSVLTPGDLAEIRRVTRENRTAAMADILAGRIGCHRRTVQNVWTSTTWSSKRRTKAKRACDPGPRASTTTPISQAQGVSHG